MIFLKTITLYFKNEPYWDSMGNQYLSSVANPNDLRKKKKPFIVRVGPVVVTIYKNTNGSASATFYKGDERQVRHYGSFATAKEEAHRIASALSTGNGDMLNVSAQKVQYFLRLEKKMEGTPLEIAVDFYKAHNASGRFKPEKVSVLVEQFLDRLVQFNKSPSHQRTARSILNRYSKAFGNRDIHTVDSNENDQWLGRQPGGLCNRSNLHRYIIMLSRFAKEKNAIVEEKTPAERVKRVTRADLAKAQKPIEIYMPDEKRRLIAASDEATLPLIVLEGDCGIRPSEVTGEGTDHEPLRWEDILWKQKCVHVGKQKIRSKAERYVPLQSGSYELLKSYQGKTGFIWTGKNSHKALRKVFKKAGVKKKHNGFRHSFISYRMAQIKNAHQVALESGTSPNMIFLNYNKPQLEDAAKEWFSILSKELLSFGNAA